MSTKGSTLATREVDITQIDADLERWTDRQAALIAKTVAKDATPEELRLFLSQAVQLNLNPLNGEIWCAKMRGENGGEGKIAIIVGEQGRLKVANRYTDYRGYRSDTVCKGDTFRKLADPKEQQGVKGGYTYIEHSYSLMDRGEVIGAWCEVYRDNKPPTFFYAPLSDYIPKNPSENAKKYVPWFKTESRMIVKCAISTAFRMAFPLLAGVYGEEEIDHRTPQPDATIADEIAWGDDPEVAERMQSLVNAANNCSPNAFTDAKLRILFAGMDDEERMSFAAKELIPFIVEHGGQVPEHGVTVVSDDDVEVFDADDPSPGMGESAKESREGARAEASTE